MLNLARIPAVFSAPSSAISQAARSSSNISLIQDLECKFKYSSAGRRASTYKDKVKFGNVLAHKLSWNLLLTKVRSPGWAFPCFITTSRPTLKARTHRSGVIPLISESLIEQKGFLVMKKVENLADPHPRFHSLTQNQHRVKMLHCHQVRLLKHPISFLQI